MLKNITEPIIFMLSPVTICVIAYVASRQLENRWRKVYFLVGVEWLKEHFDFKYFLL